MLKVVVLRIGGITEIPPPPEIPVNCEPSPTNLPKRIPAEIVEKKP